MNRRNIKPRLYSHLCRNLLIIGLNFGVLGWILSPAPVHAQNAEIDAVMTPENGEKAGKLGKGELLVNAMKREKVDGASVHKAISSIGEVFDFRLSRSGDRYVYRLTNGQKLAMLRYQRGNHVYEAVLDDSTGGYKAEIVDLKKVKVPPPANDSFAVDEDGEVDVEHAAMAEQIHAPSGDSTAQEELDSLEIASPEDPILPEDTALAGKPSPDAEFPDAPIPPDEKTDILEPEIQGGSEAEEEPSDDSLVMPNIPKQPNRIAEENTYKNEPYRGPVPQIRQKKAADADLSPFSSPLSMVSLVTLILGIVFLTAAFLICTLPWLKARRRLHGVGLGIRRSISIAPGHTLVQVEHDGQSCLIAVHPGTMSFISPCPIDDEIFWTKLRAKTYWHKMAKKPLSDRQLAALLAEIQKQDKQVKPQAAAPTPAASDSTDIPQLDEDTAENVFETGEIDDTETDEIDDTPDEEDTVYR